jgi:hypothetical protein
MTATITDKAPDMARCPRGKAVSIFLIGAATFACSLLFPSISWCGGSWSAEKEAWALTGPEVHDEVVIGPGRSRDSNTYRFYVRLADGTMSPALRISEEYLRRERRSGWYTDRVSSGPDYLVGIVTVDCVVMRPYIFSTHDTGGPADIIVARSRYTDVVGYPDVIENSAPPTILDRLELKKNKHGKWRIEFVEELVLDKFYCEGTDLLHKADEFEEKSLAQVRRRNSSRHRGAK